MSAEPGGIASKLGTIYERRYAVKQLVRLIRGRVVSLRWEPASGEAGGADIDLGHPDGHIEHVQFKRQNRALADWTPASLDQAGVLEAALRVLDLSPTARFTFVSSDPVPHLQDICDQLTRDNGTEADFIRDRIVNSLKRHACFKDLVLRWGLRVGDANDEAIAVKRLRSMTFSLFDRSTEGEEEVKTQVQAGLTGDPEVACAALAAFLESNLGKTITAQMVLDQLARVNILPRDLARDPSLPSAMLALRTGFVESLRERLVAGNWIPRSQVSDILARATSASAPRVILVHGKPGAGKSEVLLGVVNSLIAQQIPLLALSLDTHPPGRTVLQYGESLALHATPPAALRAVAGGSRAVLVVDQLDALRLTTSGATAIWGTCAEMLREAARDPHMVLIVACRTFDLENDANIRQWREATSNSAPNAVVSVEVGDLTESDVKPILQGFGVEYATLPPRLQKLLLHPSTLDAWCKLASRGTVRRDFATQTQLLTSLVDALRAEAVREHAVSDREVFETLAIARTQMAQTGRLTAPASPFDAHAAGLRACCGVGLLVRSKAAVSFPHQSYYDYFVARAALSASGHSPNQVVSWAKEDQSLERRDQLRQLLFMLRDEHPDVATTVAGALLQDDKVRFHLKHLVLGIMREADPILPGDVALVANLARSDMWREHVIGRVLWRSMPWFDAFQMHGVWGQLLAESTGDLRARWLRTILMVMDERPAEIDHLLTPILAAPDGLATMQRALWWDPSEDSPKVAELRDAEIRAGRWAVPDLLLDRTALRDPARTVRLVDSVVRGLLRKALTRLASDADDHIESLRDGALDKGVARAFRSHARTSYPKLERLIQLCERLEGRYRLAINTVDDLAANHYRLTSLFHDLRKELIPLTSHAVAGLAETDVDDLRRVLRSRRVAQSVSLSVAIASGLAQASAQVSDTALEWLLADVRRFELRDELDRDVNGLATDIVRRHSPTCSTGVLERLESTLLNLIPEREKRHYKHLLEEYLLKGTWGFTEGGRYRSLVNSVGRCQHMMLGAIPEERRSARTRERLKLWDAKFGGSAREEAMVRLKGGTITSPIPNDRVGRITDEQWLDIAVRPGSNEWKQVGPERVAEASPTQFARDFGEAAKKQPRRFVALASRLPEKSPLAFLSRLWDALGSEDVDVESCEVSQLEALLTRTLTSNDRNAIVGACRAIERHPDVEWGANMWRLLDAAASHEDPKLDTNTVHGHNASDGNWDLETRSINCVRGIAAGALAALAWNNSGRVAVVLDRAARLASDPHPAVRVAAAHVAYAVYTVNPDAAMDLIGQIAQHADDRVLGSRWLNRLIGLVRWRHKGTLHGLFSRMSESRDESVAKQGAHWITAEQFQFGACTDLYARVRHGSVAQRQGVATTLGHLICDEHADATRVETELASLFNDADADVRDSAANVFRVEGVLKSDAGPRLAEAFVQSAAFVENSEDLVGSLSHDTLDLVNFKTTVFAAVDRFAAELAEETRSMRNGTGMAGREMSSLLLRLYDAATKLGDRGMAEQCLDRWDALLVSRVGDADAALESLAG